MDLDLGPDSPINLDPDPYLISLPIHILLAFIAKFLLQFLYLSFNLFHAFYLILAVYIQESCS